MGSIFSSTNNDQEHDLGESDGEEAVINKQQFKHRDADLQGELQTRLSAGLVSLGLICGACFAFMLSVNPYQEKHLKEQAGIRHPHHGKNHKNPDALPKKKGKDSKKDKSDKKEAEKKDDKDEDKEQAEKKTDGEEDEETLIDMHLQGHDSLNIQDL